MHPDARCLDCGFLLRGLTDPRCPECGRGFSPNDPHSVNCGKPYGRRVAWMLRPTQWIAPAAPWLAWGYFSVAATLLCERLLPLVIFSLLWIVFLFPYAVRGTLRNLAVRLYRQPREFRRVDRPEVQRVFAAFSFPFILMFAGLPLHIPFYLSLPWINAIARHAYETAPSPGTEPPPRWAGLYRVTVDEVSPRTVIIDVGGSKLLYYAGPADHSLPGYFPWELTPLGGGWYRPPDPTSAPGLISWWSW